MKTLTWKISASFAFLLTSLLFLISLKAILAGTVCCTGLHTVSTQSVSVSASVWLLVTVSGPISVGQVDTPSKFSHKLGPFIYFLKIKTQYKVHKIANKWETSLHGLGQSYHRNCPKLTWLIFIVSDLNIMLDFTAILLSIPKEVKFML